MPAVPNCTCDACQRAREQLSGSARQHLAHCACGCGESRMYTGTMPRVDIDIVATLDANGWRSYQEPIQRRVWRNEGDRTTWYWENPTHALRAWQAYAGAAREGNDQAIRWLQQRGWKVPKQYPAEFMALPDVMRKMYRRRGHGSGHFGTEHEFFGIDEYHLAQGLSSRFGPNWGVKNDGSVSNEGLEIATPVLYGSRGRDELSQVLDYVAREGAQIDTTCGLHVHHSAAHLTPQNVWDCVLTYKHFQGAINSILPPSRSSNSYCNRIDYVGSRNDGPARNSTLKEMADGHWGRYYVVNLSSLRVHGTVEFRQHSATLNPEKTLNWVDLTRAMLNVGKRVEQSVVPGPRHLLHSGEYDPTSLDAMLRYLGVSTDLADYYHKRQAAFLAGGDREDQASEENLDSESEGYDFWCESCGDGTYYDNGCSGCYQCDYCGCACDEE